ncbi:MAG: DUF1566 domain-containing protein [Deltaproteobacteria bacterium]|nr:DUF1566 domain-containing protein [Deltaproteobacteria bacterium]
MPRDAARTMLAATAARSVLAVELVIVLLGCYQSYQSFAEVDSDGHVDADVVHEVDADVDADADADGDGGRDADGDVTACDGAWQDLTTGYLWETTPSDTTRNWDDAVAYCNGLSLCGYPAGSWHLPTISELRSFIRGCPDTMVGGGCRVTDSCLGSGCHSSSCYSCTPLSGPGTGGCYWSPGVSGPCVSYWSSSSYAGGVSGAWSVSFYNGYVDGYDKTSTHYVRCVRRGP